MKIIKKRTLIILSIILFVSTMGLVSALFLSADKTEEVGEMGKIDTELTEENNVMASFSDTSGLLTKEFEFANNSTIDLFVRIGYTVVHKNETNQDMLVDSNANKVETVEIYVNNDRVQTAIASIETAENYKKDFIVPFLAEDNRNVYRRIKPGENIKGTIKVQISGEGATSSDIVITSESIQATEKALVDASGYGWDLAMYK